MKPTTVSHLASTPSQASLTSRRWVAKPARRVAVQCPSFQPSKPTLFDVGLSPFGARIRYIIYKHNLEDRIDIVAPSQLGGLKSEEYLALHPAGKMPLLVLPSGQAIPESTVIQDYIVDAMLPECDLVPRTPEGKAKAAAITRYLDIYYGNVMGCMYKPMGIEKRAEHISEISYILDSIEGMCEGPFLAGPEMSLADVAAFPHFVFMTFMLPTYFGWPTVFMGRPKLQYWWDIVRKDPVVEKVIQQIEVGLESWQENGRWDKVGVNEHVKDKSYAWVH